MNAYAAAAPTRAYKESAVLTATPEQLVVMLYDGASRFLFQAATAMREGNLAAANSRLQAAEAIVDELTVTLNMEAGDVAERLKGIYVFCRRLTTEARLERNPQKIEQASRLLSELREAWAQVSTS